MSENKYDEQVFFDKYAQLERSKIGLIAAGEWKTLRKLLPSFAGKVVLDLGCGYGWHCIYAAGNGATSVVGVDISKSMLRVAKAKTKFSNVEYMNMAIEDIDFPNATFDVVLSSLAFHYIEDFPAVIEKIMQVLKPGGTLVFSVEHPVYTCNSLQDWYYDSEGLILHYPLDNYYYQGKRDTCFLGERVVKYHRTITSYLAVLLSGGWEIVAIEEPQPSSELIDRIPEMKNEMRRPMMLIVSAVKKEEKR